MKRTLLAIACLANVAGMARAQTWEQLPYHYERTTGKPKIFASKGDVLVAGIAFNASPGSHASTDGGATWH